MSVRPSDDDERHMRAAIRLAERGRGRVNPNPMVGAVIVRGGRVVGEGWHPTIGAPHAEAIALARAGSRARGATMYVTLEPCAHTGRTPPCADAIIASGIRRCVVALRDPHRIVNGRGLRRLRAAGVRVDVGLLAAEVEAQLAGYLMTHRRGRPRVTWKVAATLDGRSADARGRSRWISGPASRAYAHGMRSRSDAIVVGSGTAGKDDPRLTVRGLRAARGRRMTRGAGQPLRVVVDTRLELPRTLRLFAPALARGTVVACGRGASARRAKVLEARGVRVWRLPVQRGVVSGVALLRRLTREGVHEVLVESGGLVGTTWLRAGLVDRIALFVAPRLLGVEGKPWIGWLGGGAHGLPLERALAGRLVELRRFGDDALLVLEMGR